MTKLEPEPNTSDIPEVSPKWFDTARLILPAEPTEGDIQAMYYEAGMCGLNTTNNNEKLLRQQLTSIYRALAAYRARPHGLRGWRFHIGGASYYCATWGEVLEQVSAAKHASFNVEKLNP